MSESFRWYRLGANKDVGKTLKALDGYSAYESEYRFSKVSDHSGYIQYRFFWRTSVYLTNLGEDGSPEIVEVKAFNSYSINIVQAGKEYFLRVDNPGRSVRELMNALEMAVGFGFYAESLCIPELKFRSILKSAGELKMINARLSGSIPNDNLSAKIDIRSKNGLSLKNVSILKDVNYKVDSATYEVTFSGLRGVVGFSTSGLIKVRGDLAPKILPLIENGMIS